MTTKEYLNKEQKMLELVENIYNSNESSNEFTTILKSVAKSINRILDGMVLTEDDSTDTGGVNENELKVFPRPDYIYEYIEEEIDERETMEFQGHNSFLPLLFSEYTLSKNNIKYM